MFYFLNQRLILSEASQVLKKKITVDSLGGLNYCSAHNTHINEGIPVGLHTPRIENMLMELLSELLFFSSPCCFLRAGGLQTEF